MRALLFSSTFKSLVSLLQEEKEDDLEDGHDGGILNAKHDLIVIIPTTNSDKGLKMYFEHA